MSATDGGTAGTGRPTATVTTMAVGAGIAAGEDMAGTTGIHITTAAGGTVGIAGIIGDAGTGASAPFFFWSTPESAEHPGSSPAKSHRGSRQ